MYGRPNVSYRAPYGWGEYDTISWNWRAAWSYVTGGHGFKLGYQGTHMQYNWESLTNPALMRYTFTDGVPTSVSYTATTQWDNANQRGGALDLRAGSVDAGTDDAPGRASGTTASRAGRRLAATGRTRRRVSVRCRSGLAGRTA